MGQGLPWRAKPRSRRADVPWGDSRALAEALVALDAGEVRLAEPMGRNTTLKVGGPADVFALPASAAGAAAMMEVARRLKAPVTVVGNGSNLVVRDGGIEGLALCLKGLTALTVEDPAQGLVWAEAGVPMNRLIRLGLDEGYEGIWYLTGIPGTVGGALRMNAGTRHGDISQVVRSVTILTARGAVKEIPRDALAFDYRTLPLDPGAVILGGRLCLGRAEDPADIKRRHREVLDYRSQTQPLQMPACGSVFRNPPGDAAGRLIEQAGLKGVRVRGAQVSDRHANWIVNTGDATAADVLLLMKLMYDRVLESAKVKLVPEVEVVGVEP